MNRSGYRDRIYKGYVTERGEAIAPLTTQGLMSRAPMLRKMVRDHFPDHRDARILDLGCGHGAVIYFAQEAGYADIMGVDGSPEQVEAAQRLGIQAVIQGDLMETLRAESDASRDVVISFDVIEHFTREELLGFVDEVFRVLKPGGRWIIHVPNGESPFMGRIRYGDFTHELAFTCESLTQLLKSSGFSAISCQEDAPIPHGLKSTVRWGLWKLIRAILRGYLAVETGSGAAGSIFSQNFLAVAVK